MNALSYAAVVYLIVAAAAWIATALQFLEWIGTARLRAKAFWACVVFGAAYGAAFGSLYGPELWLPCAEGPLWAVSRGATYGSALGVFGGGVAYFFHNLRGMHVGWWVAGLFGSAASAAPVWIVSCIAAAWEPVPLYRARLLSDALWACASISMIGGFLGAELDATLRSGRSIVPGVQRLAAIITDLNRRERDR